MNAILDLLNDLSTSWWTYAWHSTWQSALVGGVLLAVVYLGRRWPAPLRCGLLLLALAKFAVPPMLSIPTGLFGLAGPTLANPRGATPESILRAEFELFRAPESMPDRSIPQRQQPFSTGSPDELAAAQTISSGNSPSAGLMQAGKVLRIGWKSVLLMLHLAGSLVALVWIARLWTRLRQALRRAQLVHPPAPPISLQCGRARLSSARRGVAPSWRRAEDRRALPRAGSEVSATTPSMEGASVALAEQILQVASQLGVRRLPRLMISAQIATPIALGLLRPTIILPLAVVERLPVAEIRTILAHELAHFRRGDLWVNALQVLLLVVWWFNPVLWLLHRVLRNVREDCCDDLLLARGLTTNEAYCDTLMHAAAELLGKAPAGPALVFAESLHPLGQRVARLMDRTIERCPEMSSFGILTVVLLGGLLLPGLRSQESKPDAASSQNPNSDNQALGQKPPELRAAKSTPRPPEELFKQLELFGQYRTRTQANVLSEFLRLEPPPVPFLIQELKNQNRPTRGEAVTSRRKAAWLLSELGRAAKPALPELIRALEDDDDEVSSWAAGGLGAIGPEAKEAVPALIEAVHFKNPRAAQALSEIAPESTEVAKLLLDAFADRNLSEDFRGQLSYALRDLKTDKAAVEQAFIRCLKEESSSHLRREILFALRSLGPGSKEGRELARGTDTEFFPKATKAELPALMERVRNPRDGEDANRAITQIRILGPDAAEAVPVLVEYFQKTNNFNNTLAAYALAAIGEKAAMTVPTLIEYIQNPKNRGRANVVGAFGNFGPPVHQAVPALIAVLEDEEMGVAHNAVLALGRIGEAAKPALPALRALLVDRDPSLAFQAANALWRIDRSQLPAVLPVLEASVRSSAVADSPDASRAHIAVRWLGEIGPDAKSTVPKLVDALRAADSALRREAAVALWKIDRRTNAIGVLINRIQSDEDLNSNERLNRRFIRLADLKQLGEIGPAARAAIPVLKEAQKDDDDEVRSAAEDALKKIQSDSEPPGVKTSAALPGELFEQLEIFGSSRKRSQAKLLEEFLRTKPAVLPFLIAELQNQTQPTRGEAIERRRKAAWILTEMGSAAKTAIPSLVKALEDDDDRAAQQSAAALEAMGSEAKAAIPALIEALKFRNHFAAGALAKIAPESPRVANALIEAFEDQSYPYRGQLLYALSNLKAERERLEATLLAAHQEPDAQIRSTSAYALNRIGAKSKEALAAINAWKQQNVAASQVPPEAKGTVPELIATLRNPPSRSDALKALQRLIQLGPDAHEAVPALIDCLNERASLHRLSAASALGAIGPAAKEAVPSLINALKEDDRAVSGNAARALGQIGPAAKLAVPVMLEALRDSDPRLRSNVAVSLWRIDPSLIPTSVTALTELLDSLPREFGGGWLYMAKVLGEIGTPAKGALTVLSRLFEETNDFQRWTAAEAICRIDPSRAGSLLPKFVQALEDRSYVDRAAVASSLGELGAVANSAVPALTAALKAEDPSLRDAAAKALAKIARETKR